MPLIDHDDMVQAFSANASDHPFRIAVLPRTPSRYRNLPDTHSINSRGEVASVDPITIAHQVARHTVVGKCLHELLCRPRGSRVFRDKCKTRRRSCARMTKTYNTRSCRVGTVKKSIATIWPT